MIAALLLKYGIPDWLAKWVAYGLLIGMLIGAAVGYRSHVYNLGVATERTRRDTIDEHNNAAAERERAALNGQILAAQTALNRARADLARLESENEHEKEISTQRAADLAAGRTRERVLVRVAAAGQAAPGGQTAGAAATSVGDGPAVEADIDPGVASWLERVRGDHNAAVERLDACIRAYDAVKAAADAMP